MIVTLDHLDRAGACQHEVNLFKATFGEQVRVTRKGCLQHAQRFNFAWAGTYLLKGKQYREFSKRLHEICDRYWILVYTVQRDTTMSVERAREAELSLARKRRQDVALAFYNASKVER